MRKDIFDVKEPVRESEARVSPKLAIGGNHEDSVPLGDEISGPISDDKSAFKLVVALQEVNNELPILLDDVNGESIFKSTMFGWISLVNVAVDVNGRDLETDPSKLFHARYSLEESLSRVILFVCQQMSHYIRVMGSQSVAARFSTF